MIPGPVPVGLVVAGRRVLVVGGGRVAARKVATFADAGALVTVVAPEVVAELEERADITIERRRYQPGDAGGYRLVITATGDPEVNQAVFDDAESAGTWCNAADDPERCSFILPAVVRRGPVTVAVSTGGNSPALAAWLRRRLEGELGPELGVVAERLAEERAAIHATGQSTEGIDWERRIEALLAEVRATPR